MTFYFANILTGAAPNDGTGDPLRTAFTKINQNFNTLTPNIGNAEIRCLSLTSTYISSFNLINSDVVYSSNFGNAGTVYTGESLTVNTVTANTYIGTISTNTASFINANIGSLTANTAIISNGSINGTVIGNQTPATGGFTTITTTGNVTLANLATLKVNTSSGTNSILNIEGLGWIQQKVMNGLYAGLTSPHTVYLWNNPDSASVSIDNISSNLTLVMDSTIVGGYFKNYVFRNITSNLLYVTLPNTVPITNNNLGTNVFTVTGNTTAFLTFRAADTTAANVFIQITN